MKTLFGTVDELGRTLAFHQERHSVLASNLANLDTPGYRPLDLQKGGTVAAGGFATMLQTDERHFAVAQNGTVGPTLAFDDAGQNGSADGNKVNLEREMAKLNANRVRYSTASELVSRRLALLRYAVSDGGG